MLIIARDAARTLPALLEALAALRRSLPEMEIVVLVDDRTRDDTARLARRANARVIHEPFKGFGSFKERGRRQCRGAWVLNLDADERPTAAALAAIERAARGPRAFAWTLDIRTTLAGRPTRRGPFAAERRLRMFPRALGHWLSEERVHETPRVSVPIRALPGIVHHASFVDARDCLARHARYGIRAAGARPGPPAPLKGWTRACWRAARQLFVHGGLIAGPPGVVLAYGQARATWLKWTAQPDDGVAQPR